MQHPSLEAFERSTRWRTTGAGNGSGTFRRPRNARRRVEICTVSLAEMGITTNRIRSQYDGMDERYAMTTDLAHPLMFVSVWDEHQLIDGWIRLFKASVLGARKAHKRCGGVSWARRSLSPLPSLRIKTLFSLRNARFLLRRPLSNARVFALVFGYRFEKVLRNKGDLLMQRI